MTTITRDRSRLVDWDRSLAPELVDARPGNAQQLMYGVGVIEVVADLAAAVRPRGHAA